MNNSGRIKKPSLTIKEKLEIYDKLKQGTSNSDIVEIYNTSQSTISRISQLTENQIIDLRLLKPGMKNAKRCVKFDTIEDFVLQYVEKCNNMSFPICGFLMKDVALKYALKYDITNFKASNGWLEKFLKRNDIILNTIYGENKSADHLAAIDFVTSFDITKLGYEERNIFNFDETGLFIKMMPDKSYAFKRINVKGFKKAKERVSILLGASMIGEKMPLLLIGKSKNPRSFKNKCIDDNFCMYANNKTAWMTKEIFLNYFTKINSNMIKGNRNILVLIDNCTAHKIEDFSNIKFVFLPANTTSLIQPLDMGIIRNFKLKYRQAFLNTIYDSDPNNVSKNLKNFNLYRVVEHANYAWSKVTVETIKNCFTILTKYGNSLPEYVISVSNNLNVTEMKYGNFIINALTTDEYLKIDNKENLAAYNAEELAKYYCDSKTNRNPNNESKETKKCLLIQLRKKIIDAKEFSNYISSITSSLFDLENQLNEEINNL